jgi:hypothetical protein
MKGGGSYLIHPRVVTVSTLGRHGLALYAYANGVGKVIQVLGKEFTQPGFLLLGGLV